MLVQCLFSAMLHTTVHNQSIRGKGQNWGEKEQGVIAQSPPKAQKMTVTPSGGDCASC